MTKAATLLLLVAICVLLSFSAANDCSFSDAGGSYDFSKLTSSSFYSAIQGTGNTAVNWKVNICKNVIGGTCTGAACQGTKSAGNLPAKFTELPSKKEGATLTYIDGEYCTQFKVNRSTLIYLTCDANVTAPIITDIQEHANCEYSMTMTSALACRGGSSGMDFGWILILIVVIVIILYLIIGSIYKWKVQGESGLMVIPNIEFWLDLPVMVKDGFVFAWRKITCKSDYQTL
eukprot:TRINITY_DN8_c0_g1_i1.p1 TRINITY_DN8_c0_g1~~TRINITY_DN8_c0_g1_i1.p1  ORF type:complete len:232 (-),score=83.54 TRINITY_DN8_c0_g1_i1:107-802(-)